MCAVNPLRNVYHNYLTLKKIVLPLKRTTPSMTRCDYDVVFYRVFCITLLGIAFTFTVILTNVFVDIDGLLTSSKEKLNDDIIRNEFTTEAPANNEMNYGEGDDSYRTKRSIETQSFLFHIKNPKVKNILANRLSTLLEELEAEENADMKTTEKNTIEEIPKAVEKAKAAAEEKDKILHLGMHNILLQGIEKHLDLNDVFKKMFALMSSFNHLNDKKEGLRTKPNEIGKEEMDPKLQKPIEDKIFDEMINCNRLQDQMMQSTTVKPAKAPPNIVIKTIIDITSTDSDKFKENDTKLSNENIQGDIELVYNGKVIKFTNTGEAALTSKKVPVAYNPKRAMDTTTTYDYKTIPKSYMDKFVEEYFKHFPHDPKEHNEINGHFQTKRLKRHVRIKYENSGETKKHTGKKNTEEDELYVEIETHFDSKGMKGEKKKKLIKSLVEKIQNAIHSDLSKGKIATGRNNTQQTKSIQFRKRIQNPLLHNVSHVLSNKYNLPITTTVHRQQDPISKTVPLKQPESPLIDTKSGEETWRKPNFGPRFLAGGKAINSAELSQVNVDYSKILEVNGIPQRLQQPLNTDMSEETIKTNSYYDMGKMKFVIKDIDGSGFSVGFNQYVGEPPDPESMKLFAGVENIIKSYHQAYDQAPEPVSTTEANFIDEEIPLESPDNEHNIERRSIKNPNDYHSNEYKVIFNNDFLPYKDYRDIYKGKKSKSHKRVIKRKKEIEPLVLDENIFEKNLKPAEILSLADLFDRKKRSINVKKMSNLNTRLKYNKFLNTNAMAKTIYLNTKRNKRQINKIRIIASDLPHMSKQSDENIYVVSDENVFADRAVLKEAETSEDHEKQEETEMFPYQNNDPAPYITKIFDGRSRRNPLMSKYPHIFMDEVSRSREQFIPNNALLFGKLGFGKTNAEPEIENTDDKMDIDQFMTATFNDTDSEKPIEHTEYVSSLIGSPPTKSNYKVTVKIVPKNQTGINSGFKEIHTSINKSFNKNGLLYSSLVNVSEISKVVKLNRSKDEAIDEKEPSKQEESFLTRKIHDQQEKMQFLLKQHARHINEQLNRLNEEKMHLESMLNSDNNTDINNHALHMTIRRLEMVKDEVNGKTTVAPKVFTVKPREKLFQITTTPAPTTPQLSFSDRLKNNHIISTIERNGNLTDQILKKIDRNTEVLQMFLRKLTERIETAATAIPKVERVTKEDTSYTEDWRNQQMPFTQNMVIRKNDSHISIPFTYAYQPPTSASLPLKSKTQVASVIYQGHIRNAILHRDLMLAGDKENQIQKVPEAHNQSRFFIDELENEYKVVQLGDVKKNQEFIKNLVNRNGTMT